MKTIRKLSKSPFLLAIIGLSFLTFSCGKEPVIKQVELSGEEMIKGILFIDGPATDFVSPISELKLEVLVTDEKDLQNVREGIDLLLDRVEKTNPGIFDEFKSDMSSGDHILISNSLTKYSSIISESAKEFLAENDFQVTENIDEPLIELVDTYFPTNFRQELTPNNVKDILNSPEFNSDVSDYFASLDTKIQANSRASESQLALIIFAAAVLAFASIALIAIYAVAILTWAYLWGWSEVDWGDIFWAAQRNAGQSQSLLKDQVINSIAVNFSASE